MTNTTETIENLRRRWHSLSVELPEALFDDLATRHAEPQRHYHTFEHIADCFEKLDACCAADDSLHGIAHHSHPAIELALFYHDAIYDPQRSDNEQESANLALVQLTPHLEQIDLTEVELLIKATAHFSDETPKDLEADEDLIVDIDLSILGSNPATYNAYARKIRSEYQHVPDPAYRKGRSAVLKKFLKAPKLFSTPWFHDRFEENARRNLPNELTAMQRP